MRLNKILIFSLLVALPFGQAYAVVCKANCAGGAPSVEKSHHNTKKSDNEHSHHNEKQDSDHTHEHGEHDHGENIENTADNHHQDAGCDSNDCDTSSFCSSEYPPINSSKDASNLVEKPSLASIVAEVKSYEIVDSNYQLKRPTSTGPPPLKAPVYLITQKLLI